MAEFGEGSGTIYLNDVACTGSESRLMDCTYDPDTSDCGHHDDAGVRCVPGEIIVYNYILRTESYTCQSIFIT